MDEVFSCCGGDEHNELQFDADVCKEQMLNVDNLGVGVSHGPVVAMEPLPTSNRRRTKPVRLVNFPLLVVGEDIALNNIVLTHALTLVGHFSGRKVSPAGIKNWALGTWHNISCPDIFILLRGWLAFKFHSEEDSARILSGTWKWHLSGLLLKHWTPLGQTTELTL